MSRGRSTGFTADRSGRRASGIVLTVALTLSACGTEGSEPSLAPQSHAPSASATGSVAPEVLEPIARVDVGADAGLIFFDDEAAWVGVESGVVRIDPETNEVKQVVNGLTPPFGLNIGFGSAWISRADEAAPRGWIERYDLESGELVASVDVGLMPLETITAFGSIWVPNHHSSSVSRIDPATNEVIATIQVQNGFGDPYGLAASDDRIWTASPNGGSISAIDPRTNEVTAEVTASACWMAVGAGRLWAPNCEGTTVAVIDLADASVSARLDAPPAGTPLIDADRTWSASLARDSRHLLLTSLDPETLEYGTAMDTGIADPFGYAVGFGTLWVSKGGEVVRFDF